MIITKNLDVVIKKLIGQKTLIRFLTSSFVALPISIVTGFLTFRNIDPFLMGIWASLSVFETYANVMRFGVINGMNRELPLAFGKNEIDKAYRFAQTTLAYTLIISTVLLIAVPIYIWYADLRIEYRIASYFLVIKLFLSFYSSYLTGTFRSSKHFDQLSNIQFITSFSRLILCPVILFGFYGFLVYDLFYNLLSTILFHYNRPLKIKPKIYFTELKNLASIGLPIFIVSYVIGIIDTLPRLYIIFKGGEYLMGLLAPVGILLNIMSMIPTALTTYLYPKFLFSIGNENNPIKVWKHFFNILIISFGALSILSLISSLFLNYFVEFFPKYENSKPYLYISLFLSPLVIYKMGYMLTTVFKQYKFMFFYVLIYGLTQVSSILIISQFETDVLKVSLYSQLGTNSIVLIGSMIANKKMINELVRVQRDANTGKISE